MPNIGKAASDAAREMHAPPDRMAEVAQQSEGWTWRDGLKAFQAKCAESAIPCVSPEEAKAARDKVCDATGRKDLIGKPFGKMDFADFQVLCFSTDTYVGACVNAKTTLEEAGQKDMPAWLPPDATRPTDTPRTDYSVTRYSVRITRRVTHNYNSFEASVGFDGDTDGGDVEAHIRSAIARCKQLVDAEIASDKGAE